MKRKILPVLSLLAAMTLVACGEKPADKSGAAPTSKTPAATSKAPVSKHTHTYNESVWEHDEENHWHPATCEHNVHGSEAPHTFVVDETKSTQPTCKQGGSLVYKCSVCGYEKAPETKEASYQYHVLGERNWTKKAAVLENLNTTTETLVKTCTACNSKDIILNALDFTAFNNADTSKAFNKIDDMTRIKFSSNNSWAEYTFNAEADMDAMLYLYGAVDYWKDNNNNNHNRGFFNSGNAVNVAFTLNEENITVTNTHSYLEMGIPDPVEPNPLPNSTSGFGLAEVAFVHVKAGQNVIRYTRKGSYNMDITEIHFIEHKHEHVEGTKAGSLTPISCSCGQTGYQLVVADCTEGQKNPVVENTNDAKNTRLGKSNIFDDVWSIAGIAAGTYDLYLNAAASSGNANKGYWNSKTAVDDHGDTKGNNGGDELYLEYKYKVKIDSGEYTNLGDATNNYASYGIQENKAGWTNKALARIEIGADAATLTIHNMNNGYALWVLGVRLIKVA